MLPLNQTATQDKDDRRLKIKGGNWLLWVDMEI